MPDSSWMFFFWENQGIFTLIEFIMQVEQVYHDKEKMP